jgi:hypothetical protein
MKSSIFASVIAFAAAAFAAPVTSQTSTIVARNATQVSSSSPTQTIQPGLQVRWKSKEPNRFGVNERVGHLLSNPNEQVHTAVYFNLSEEQARGKTCKLVFRLSSDDWIVTPNPGAQAAFYIYRLNGCLNERYTWSNKVTRGVPAGVLYPVKGGAASWQGVDMSADTMLPHMGAAPSWSCQAGEYSFELIARPGSNIGWTSGRGSGLTIETCG